MCASSSIHFYIVWIRFKVLRRDAVVFSNVRSSEGLFERFENFRCRYEGAILKISESSSCRYVVFTSLLLVHEVKVRQVVVEELFIQVRVTRQYCVVQLHHLPSHQIVSAIPTTLVFCRYASIFSTSILPTFLKKFIRFVRLHYSLKNNVIIDRCFVSFSQ